VFVHLCLAAEKIGVDASLKFELTFPCFVVQECGQQQFVPKGCPAVSVLLCGVRWLTIPFPFALAKTYVSIK